MIYLPIGMKSEHCCSTSRTTARLRPDVALDRAMHVFWAKGYEGAALSDLTQAMRINRPSLYAAFGNKEQLFRKVLDRYMQAGRLLILAKLWRRRRRGMLSRQILLGAAKMASDPRLPAGCLMVQGALACGDSAGSVQKEIAARRAASEVALRRRLQRAKREGDLPRNADPAELAQLRDDCAARNGSPGSQRRQAKSTTSSRANRIARVAQTLDSWTIRCQS